jgi:MtfA peptidase
MDGGPLTLSWQDVQNTPARSAEGFNLVIHEFAHVLDMKNGHANGVPLLPDGFWATGMPSAKATRGGKATSAEAYGHWQRTMSQEFEAFTERLSLAQRFGGEIPWLDAYAGTAPEEFFAVTAEAYFTNPKALTAECPSLIALYDAYFQAWRWR